MAIAESAGMTAKTIGIFKLIFLFKTLFFLPSLIN